MKLKKIRIKNFKSFKDSQDIELSPTFNFIVGKNDSGKSAFLEAASLSFKSAPHASIHTKKYETTILPSDSNVSYEYEITEDDINLFFSASELIGFPAISAMPQIALGDFLSCRALKVLATNGNIKKSTFPAIENEAKYTFVARNNGFPSELNLTTTSQQPGMNIAPYSGLLTLKIASNTYAFKAERLNIGESKSSGLNTLEPNASNLPDVINQLRSTSSKKFAKLSKHMQEIFPHIKEISAPSNTHHICQILISEYEPSEEREDLATPLSQSGTGIGQVLAMLYVIVTSSSSKLIIIDEPQSFLHPGAFRKLVEILRSYDKHQYIISTHSPVAIDPSGKDKILLLKKENHQTSISEINHKSQDDMNTFLNEVGARLSDVFGTDNILWVEGKTEEQCFPVLIRRIGMKALQGTSILGVINTGDLSGKHAKRVYEIYSKLSGEASLLPPAISFIFDSEERTENEKEDIDRKSEGLVKWLPLRMYENYLLEPNAIAALINEIDIEREEPISAIDIEKWISKNGREKKYKASNHEVNTPPWLKEIHGAALLEDLFDFMTNARTPYEKVSHGVWLTTLLTKNPTPQLTDLTNMLVKILEDSRGETV